MRQRTISPGFFINEQLAECDSWARILFAGLWCMADREGRLQDRPKKIAVEVLPYDQDKVDVAALIDQLERVGLVARYQADGMDLLEVTRFKKHQRPHPREAPSTLPARLSTESRVKVCPGREKDMSSPSGPSGSSGPSGPSGSSGPAGSSGSSATSPLPLADPPRDWDSEAIASEQHILTALGRIGALSEEERETVAQLLQAGCIVDDIRRAYARTVDRGKPRGRLVYLRDLATEERDARIGGKPDMSGLDALVAEEEAKRNAGGGVQGADRAEAGAGLPGLEGPRPGHGKSLALVPLRPPRRAG